MSFIIRDGWTEEDTFPGSHWIDPLKFKYRPCLTMRFYEYQEAEKDTSKKLFNANIKLIQEHLVSWDVTDKNGVELPFTDDKIWTRIPHQIITYMRDCITGYGPNRPKKDEIKEITAEKNSESVSK
jgi:hypothetical protein